MSLSDRLPHPQTLIYTVNIQQVGDISMAPVAK